jgi:hypothetical protein
MKASGSSGEEQRLHLNAFHEAVAKNQEARGASTTKPFKHPPFKG